jgi:hypothetical protein
MVFFRSFSGSADKFSEVWRDGEKVKELRRREAELATQKTDIKQAKNQLRQRKKGSSDTGTDPEA